MGIYIRGMEMPKNCADCPINHDAECAVKNCMVTDDCYVRRASWCPLIPVPPHGRLNVIEPYMQHDEDDGFDELIKPSDIDYMHHPSVEEIIEGNGFDSFIKHFED